MNFRLRPVSRSVTLDDVAAHCGVSYQTVSRVANGSPLVTDKTRARVLKAIAELGYRPNLAARRLATRRSSVIGMVGTNITCYGPAQVMVSIEETAKRRGYHLMFAGVEHPSRARVIAAIDDLCDHQIDGLVLGVRVKGNNDFIRKFYRGIPFVTTDAGKDPGVPTVIVDQAHGVRLATQHLLDLGHQRIACIAGPPGWAASSERQKAWAQTLKNAGLEPGPCVEGDWSAESGFAAVVRLLESAPGFTAIVIGNDHMALGALRALHARKVQVPKQISVVGYEDLPESRFFEPPLTTIHHDFTKQGERCVEVLLSMINRQPVDPPLQLLRPELVIRESTAATR